MAHEKNPFRYSPKQLAKKTKLKKSTRGNVRKRTVSKKHIKVAELFAGVGGFRLGLERASKKYKIVWSNQWEPKTIKQHASEVYKARFGSANHSSEDIATVDAKDVPSFNMLVAGFPCQDYSIANRNNSDGITGKKGVLWWEIHRIAKEHLPMFMLLENVDRLLTSPSKQKGRDFAIMLASLSDLGYAVEWRIINSADYGMPQRRKRVFIFACRNGSSIFLPMTCSEPKEWLLKEGIFASCFPVMYKQPSVAGSFKLNGSLEQISDSFSGRFLSSGIMVEREVHTIKTVPVYNGKRSILQDVLEPLEEVPTEFKIAPDRLAKWQYCRGAKNEQRYSKRGGCYYNYKEGAMAFPDPLDRPSRTIITSEGEVTPSRTTHIILQDGTYRKLTPLELERLNMFPDNHTLLEGITNPKRAFFMGNALVIGVVEKIAKEIMSRVCTQ